MKNIKYIILVLFLANFLSLEQISAQERKPDLTITYVSSQDVTIFDNSNPNDAIVRSGYLAAVEYTLTIRNTGTAECSEPFYIFWTSSDADLRNGHYSGGELFNKEEETILVGGSLEVKIVLRKSINSIRSKRFLINTDGKEHLKKSTKVIDELNYYNNTYEY